MENIVLHFYDYSPVGNEQICDKLGDYGYNKYNIGFFYEEVNKLLRGKNVSNILLESDKKSSNLFEYFNGEWRTGGYVGSITVKLPSIDEKKTVDVTLYFNSRFDKESNSGNFVMYVFEKAFGINGRIYEDMEVNVPKEDTWDFLLMLLFFQQFQQAFKAGLFREYRDFEHNDSNPRGTIDIARHIKENAMLQNGKICYNTREYTVDNPTNRLILRAADCLERKYKSAYRNYMRKHRIYKNGLDTLRGELFDISPMSDLELIKRASRKIVKPVFVKYEPLRQTAIMVLKRLGFNSLKNSSHKVSGILIYMPGLWEKFLYHEILSKAFEGKHVAQQIGIEVLNGKKTFRPDFVISDNSNKENDNSNKENIVFDAVFDAKYKNCWESAYNSSDSSDSSDKWKYTDEDIDQVMAYMLALKDCKTGGVIFPVRESIPPSEQEQLPSKTEQLIQEYEISVFEKDKKFLLVPYIIPDQENYGDFRNRMSEIGEKLVGELKSYRQKAIDPH